MMSDDARGVASSLKAQASRMLAIMHDWVVSMGCSPSPLDENAHPLLVLSRTERTGNLIDWVVSMGCSCQQ